MKIIKKEISLWWVNARMNLNINEEVQAQAKWYTVNQNQLKENKIKKDQNNPH